MREHNRISLKHGEHGGHGDAESDGLPFYISAPQAVEFEPWMKRLCINIAVSAVLAVFQHIIRNC